MTQLSYDDDWSQRGPRSPWLHLTRAAREPDSAPINRSDRLFIQFVQNLFLSLNSKV
ncbi:hypothetical protein HanRHA438_Chr15g0703041 [Helianthus annuus]|nr:hypothetical protein HanRHA438_Chr15g0703041 [Helianthus annuus]